jgi:hypothetical protein
LSNGVQHPECPQGGQYGYKARRKTWSGECA